MNRMIIITGAGSGIGREFVKLFLADGSRVLAVSLLQTELEQLTRHIPAKAGQLITMQMDLSAPDAAERLLSLCDERGIIPDVLINNAGFACFGEAVDEKIDKVTSMIALNITTLTKLCLFFGARMKAQGGGRILNVGSTAGMVPTPKMAAYCASKSYVNSFSIVLAEELKSYGVSVTCLAPGATQTNFAEAGGILDFKGESRLKSMFAAQKGGSPVKVAKAGYQGLFADKKFVLSGKGAWIAPFISRLFPLAMIPRLLGKVL